MTLWSSASKRRAVPLALTTGAIVGGYQLWSRVLSNATIRPAASLMCRLLRPQPGMTAYDPGFGTGNLLAALDQSVPDGALRLYGQELDRLSFLVGRVWLRYRRVRATLARGDSFRNPAFVEPDGSPTRFDLIVANPMWNQQIPRDVYENDQFGRFIYGIPPSESGDWGWAQHLVASLKPAGRMAFVVDRAALSRGSNDGTTGPGSTGHPERAIRKGLVEADLLEAVLCCSLRDGGQRLVGNVVQWAVSHSVLLIFNKDKRRPGEILFIDASSLWGQGTYGQIIDRVVNLYHDWSTEPGLAFVGTVRDTAANDFDLDPARYTGVN